jgi:hypothetical protein
MRDYDQVMLQLHLMNERRLARGGGFCPACTAAQASALDALRRTR